MMRNTEVPDLMRLVEGALLRRSTSADRSAPIILTPDGEGDIDIARLRHRATIHVDQQSGSARPIVGPAIVAAKRIVRRGLRWYLKPPFDQQTTFNHNVLDLFERARLENERLRREVEALREVVEAAPAAAPAPAAAREGEAAPRP